MKVFISWSGERSQALAQAFREWLPNVIQAVQPWMSAADIEKGTRWSSDIAGQLEETRVGIVCLTPDSLEAPWIHFEAGALSKTVQKTYVCPYLLEVEPTDIKGPLVQFQAARANKDDTRKLLHTINRALDREALTDSQLDNAFEKWWPDLEQRLEHIPDVREPEPQRANREILQEILELARAQERRAQEESIAQEERMLAQLVGDRTEAEDPTEILRQMLQEILELVRAQERRA